RFFFISDIAIPLYYAVWGNYRNEDLETRSAFGEEFLTAFLRGYLEEYTIEEEWIELLPEFLLLRDLTLYSVFHKKWDIAHLSESESLLVMQIRNRLLADEPIVSLDYRGILQKLSKRDRI